MTGLGGKKFRECKFSLHQREVQWTESLFSEKMYIHVYRHSSGNDMIHVPSETAPVCVISSTVCIALPYFLLSCIHLHVHVSWVKLSKHLSSMGYILHTAHPMRQRSTASTTSHTGTYMYTYIHVCTLQMCNMRVVIS